MYVQLNKVMHSLLQILQKLGATIGIGKKLGCCIALQMKLKFESIAATVKQLFFEVCRYINKTPVSPYILVTTIYNMYKENKTNAIALFFCAWASAGNSYQLWVWLCVASQNS